MIEVYESNNNIFEDMGRKKFRERCRSREQFIELITEEMEGKFYFLEIVFSRQLHKERLQSKSYTLVQYITYGRSRWLRNVAGMYNIRINFKSSTTKPMRKNTLGNCTYKWKDDTTTDLKGIPLKLTNMMKFA